MHLSFTCAAFSSAQIKSCLLKMMTFKHNQLLFVCLILSLTPLVRLTHSASIQKAVYDDSIDQSTDEAQGEEEEGEDEIDYDQVLLNLLNLYKNRQEEITAEEKLMFQMALSMIMQMKRKIEDGTSANTEY
jgi:transcription elongation factor Elf1